MTERDVYEGVMPADSHWYQKYWWVIDSPYEGEELKWYPGNPFEDRRAIGKFMSTFKELAWNNFIYYDIKPSNTVVDKNGHPREIDTDSIIGILYYEDASTTFSRDILPLFLVWTFLDHKHQMENLSHIDINNILMTIMYSYS